MRKKACYLMGCLFLVWLSAGSVPAQLTLRSDLGETEMHLGSPGSEGQLVLYNSDGNITFGVNGDHGTFYFWDGSGAALEQKAILAFNPSDTIGPMLWGNRSDDRGDFLVKSNDDVDFYLDQQGDGSLNEGFFRIHNHSFTTIWSVDEYGNTTAAGSKSAVVQTKSYGPVRMYALESTRVMFEDFGSGRLADGSTAVPIDPKFAETVNLQNGYHVYLTPVDGWAPLYVAKKSEAGFEVRDASGRGSDIHFDYRIVAVRIGYEGVRMEPNPAEEETRADLERAANRPLGGDTAKKVAFSLIGDAKTTAEMKNRARRP